MGILDCRYQLGDVEGALEAGKRLLVLRPEDGEANLRVAELLLAAGHDTHMAEPYLARARGAAVGTRRMGGDGSTLSPSPAAASSSSALQHRVLCAQAEAALAQEDHQKALSTAAEAVRLDASLPRGLILLGSARIRVAEYAAGIRALTAASDALAAEGGGGGEGGGGAARRMRAAAHALAAQAHERLRQYPQALSQAQRALGQDPQLTLARVVRSMALHQTGQLRDAERELDEALRADPASPIARLQLGYCRLCLGDHVRAMATLEVLDGSGTGALRSQLGAAKAYMALAMEMQVERGGDAYQQRFAEEAVRSALSFHRNLEHIWSEIEGGAVANPLEAVQRLRGICDLDLTTLQAKSLLRLMARASDRADLLQGMSSLAVPMQGRREGGHGSVSRQTSAPPPNRWATGACYDGARGVLGSGASTPVSDRMGGGLLRGPSAAGSPLPRALSQESQGYSGAGFAHSRQPSIDEGPGRGSWALHGNLSGPSTRAESQFSGTPHRGRSMSPAGGKFDGAPGGRGGAYGGYGGGGGFGLASPQQQGIRPRAGGGGSRETSLPRGGGSGSGGAGGGRTAQGSRDQSPTGRSSNDLAIGWNELIQPEQLVFGPALGAGGSAHVYRGSLNGQEVAIKKITGMGHLEEMKKEINALRRLRNPRLVRFIGACLQPPLLLVVTEFMPGGSLHDRLFGPRRDPALAPEQKWSIASQTTEGLSFLHAQRVVHRDLKSMNILLDARQNAKICDFGLAQQMEATHIVRKIDGEGGSPRYMAPECYDASHGKLTEKVDVWSMGCILIELFAGVLPYADCSTMAQLSARILVERRPPDLPHGLAPPVVTLIQQCVSFDPARRPSASELQYELARLSCLCAR